MTGGAMAVGIYLRVSTEDQRERQSIDTQRVFATQYCSMHGLRIHDFYADDGVSGKVPLHLRSEGTRMLRDAGLKKFDRILVYKLDRLGRDTRLILNAVDELEKLGVPVRSMTEDFDNSTAQGRLMMTMLSGFATHEHAVIRERSMAGTNRVAEAGAWLGGIVPFGYRKQGEKAQARLVISEDTIPRLDLSEAEIIRIVFRMAAIEKKSCFVISDYLNLIGVPCAYVRDDRMVSRGKRIGRTAGLWRPSRVRNLLVNTTYMGRHEYGKRSKNQDRQVITRTVPAIVPAEIWQKAQQTLSSNMLFGKRNAKRQYLLRGLAKCGNCGLTYCGYANRRPSGRQERYYRCNGKQAARGTYGPCGNRCPSKDVNGDFLESAVWGDVESFLRNPAVVIEKLLQRLAAERGNSKRSQEHLHRLKATLAGMETQRDRILTLFRKNLINENDLERQLGDIGHEEAGLRANVEEVSAQLQSVQDGTLQLQSAEALLKKLRGQLDAGLSWEVKRQLIEALVGGIRIDTCEGAGKRYASIVVTYRFVSSIDNCTDRDSLPQPLKSGPERLTFRCCAQ